MNQDLISRQAAIDALNKMKIYRPLDSDRYVISDCLNKIVNLPSAQPEHLVKESDNLVNGLVNDCISRQAAIDAIKTWGLIDGLSEGQAIEILADEEKLPSAQPEIIRCNDCKWCEDADGLMCKNPASWVVATDYDFGCVYAERRQDG